MQSSPPLARPFRRSRSLSMTAGQRDCGLHRFRDGASSWCWSRRASSAASANLAKHGERSNQMHGVNRI